jgi:hypothetical protein
MQTNLLHKTTGVPALVLGYEFQRHAYKTISDMAQIYSGFNF